MVRVGKMHRSLLTSLLFILLILLNSSSSRTSKSGSNDLDGAIEQFVELSSDIHVNGFIKNHAKTIKDILDQIDAHIDLRTKELAKWEMEAQNNKRRHMLIEKHLHLMESYFRDGEGGTPAALEVLIKTSNSSMYEAFKLLDENIDVSQSSIELIKRIRDHVYIELQLHSSLEDADLNANPDYLQRRQQLDNLRKQFKPLLERALRYGDIINELPRRRSDLKANTADVAYDDIGLTESKRTEL